jgi:hypothetical protein
MIFHIRSAASFESLAHPMKIPVHKIQPCFTISVLEFVNDSETTWIQMQQFCCFSMQKYFVAQVEPAIILNVSNQAEISYSFSLISTCI